jgi:hypothetical protein
MKEIYVTTEVFDFLEDRAKKRGVSISEYLSQLAYLQVE